MSRKIMWMRICALLLLSGMLLSFVSCGKSEEPDETKDNSSSKVPLESDDGTGVTDSNALLLFENGKTDFSIVYPEMPGNDVFSAVRDLQAAFSDYGNTKIEILEEGRDIKTPDSNAFEILVGETGREESNAVKNKMPDLGGYAIVRQENKLVFYATKEQSLVKAISHFIKNNMERPARQEEGSKLTSLRFSSEDDYYYVRQGMMTSVLVDGTELENFKIVVPQKGYIEQYLGELLADYLFSYYGRKTPTVLTDTVEKTGKEIIIGQTSHTALTAEKGQYKVAVTENGIEAVSDSVTGYMEVFEALKKAIPSSKASVTLTIGEQWSGSVEDTVQTDKADICLMYHNVLGYVEKYPAANRPKMALQIYLSYLPDAIGMQECGQTYYRSEAKELMDGLAAAGYKEICFPSKGGTGNPIFYRTDRLTLVESGYERARSGDKGTTWAVFTTTDGKMLAMTNSHFAANSNAGGNAEKGNTYRVEDANTLLAVVNTIHNKYPDIPIISGGDFNSSMSSDPGKTLKNGGLKHITDVAAVKADYSAWIGYPVYNKESGYYMPRGFVWASISGALDHIMLSGNMAGLEVLEYAILKDRISCVVSDHMPQLIYANWKS